MLTLDRHRLNRLHRRLATHLLGDDVARGDGHCRLPPEWLVLGINNFCNLKCKMCDVGLGDSSTVFWANLIGNHPQNMSLDLLREILRQAAAWRPRPNVGLAFTEPLVHRDILDFCREIVGAGFYCQITSNGTMLPRLAEQLVEIGVDEIVISVDGPAAVHDRVRGRAGTFAALFAGVTRLNAAKTARGRARPRVRFSFTITDENYHHILDFVREVAPLRLDGINISQLNFITASMAETHNARFNGELAVMRSNLGEMTPETFEIEAIATELARLFDYARTQGEALPPIHLTPDTTDPERLATFYREPLTFIGGRTCTDPWRLLMVKTDGTVIPAHGRCYNFPVGNVREKPLTTIWNSERFVEFRRTLHTAGGTLPACARCCGVIGKPAPAPAG